MGVHLEVCSAIQKATNSCTSAEAVEPAKSLFRYVSQCLSILLHELDLALDQLVV